VRAAIYPACLSLVPLSKNSRRSGQRLTITILSDEIIAIDL